MKRIGMIFSFLLFTSAGFAQQPTAGGVVNAGSYAFAGLPNAPIAKGSLFIVFGTNMGPATLQGVPSFPLPTTLAGTSVSVTVSGTTTQSLFIYTSAGQVAAVLPSSTPVGTGTLTVAYNGQSSAPLSIQVVENNFGVFTWNQGGSGTAIVLDGSGQKITPLHPAAPNQEVAIWGTGLGPISGDESQPPVQANMTNVPVEVYVGTAKADLVYRGRTNYAGVDQINFRIPAGQLGCNVSLLVKIGNLVSNSSTIAVGNGGICSDPGGISSNALQQLASGGTIRIGSVGLSRNTTQIALPPPLPSQTTTTESGGASFLRFNQDAFLLSGGSFSSVSVGGCSVFVFRGESAQPAMDPFTGLDAGSSITVNGPNGTRQLTKVPQVSGSYAAQLSGVGEPSYLTSGTYTISGPGGADVGAFQTSLSVGAPFTWLNQGSISTVNRSQDLLITWSGGPANGQVTISGTSIGSSGSSAFGAAFTCLAPASAGQFTVPSVVLLSLPAASQSGGFTLPTGYLYVGTQTYSSFTASGIDQGVAVHSDSTGKSVSFQ